MQQIHTNHLDEGVVFRRCQKGVKIVDQSFNMLPTFFRILWILIVRWLTVRRVTMYVANYMTSPCSSKVHDRNYAFRRPPAEYILRLILHCHQKYSFLGCNATGGIRSGWLRNRGSRSSAYVNNGDRDARELRCYAKSRECQHSVRGDKKDFFIVLVRETEVAANSSRKNLNIVGNLSMVLWVTLRVDSVFTTTNGITSDEVPPLV